MTAWCRNYSNSGGTGAMVMAAENARLINDGNSSATMNMAASAQWSNYDNNSSMGTTVMVTTAEWRGNNGDSGGGEATQW